MPLCVEASYGDHHYLNYKRDVDGVHSEKNVTKSHPEVGVAVFGLGRIGTIHLDNLRRNPRARVLYCIEEFTERVNFLQNTWNLEEPETKFLKPEDIDKVFKDKRVDAVVICTPTFAHEELVLKSLESGKAVFCEKPLAISEEGIKRCLDAMKKSSKPLLTAFNRPEENHNNSKFVCFETGADVDLTGYAAEDGRSPSSRHFDPGMRRVKARVDAGDIGKVQVIKTCSRDSPKPSTDYLKISGGIFHDCAVHDLDLICWILGEYPESVSSYAHAHFEDVKELGDYDTVAIMMKFPSGSLATIDLSRYSVYGYDQRLEVFGDKGMLTNGDHRPVGVELHNQKGTTAVPIFYSFASRYQEAYKAEMEHFLNVCQGIEECEISPESVLAISKIATACEQVVNTGKSLSLDLNRMTNGY